MNTETEYQRGYKAGYQAGRNAKIKGRSNPAAPRAPITQEEQARLELPALRYMIGKGWIFSGLVPDRWREDVELSNWLRQGWVEMDPRSGFRITPAGEDFAIRHSLNEFLNKKQPPQP